MNEVVGICLHRARFAAVLGVTFVVCGRCGACGDGVKAVLQQWASRPRAGKKAMQCTACAAALQNNDVSTYAVGAAAQQAMPPLLLQ